MKKIIFMIVGFMPLYLIAQSVQLIDKSTHNPLADVAVMSDNEIIAITGLNGMANISTAKVEMIVFNKMGYETTSILKSTISDGAKIEMLQKTYDLNPVVVSGSRFPDSLRTLAQQINVISSSEIAFQNAMSTADVLQNTGEVLVQKSQFGGGSPMLRGFEASRILLVVDGVRMNNAIYRAGHLQNSVTMDQAMLDNIEIAYGPSSVVYGSDALGGVIHFRSKNPTLLTDGNSMASGNVSARYGTAASDKTAHFDLNLAGKNIASLTSVTYSNFDDLHAGGTPNKDNKYGSFGFRPIYQETINGVDTIIVNPDSTKQVASGYSQYDILEKILYQPNENTSHLLNLQFSNSTDVPRYDRLTVAGSGPNTLKSAEWYYGPQTRFMASYQFSNTKATKIYDDMHIIASYQHIVESRNDRGFGKKALTSRTENVGVIGLTADFMKNIGSNKLHYGLEGYFNDVQSEGTSTDVFTDEVSPASTRYPDGGSTMNMYAVYANHSLAFADNKLILHDGLRFNITNLNASFIDTTFYPFPYSDITQNNSALTGSIGLTYLPADDWKIAILGSTGFKAPNVDDLAKVFDSEPGIVVVPNPNLKPEYTYNTDLQIAKEFGDLVELEVTGFYTIYRNYFTTAPSTFNGQDSIMYDGQLSEVLTSTNFGKAFIYGFNAGIDINITDYLSLSSYINYTYGRIETDTTPIPLDHIPPVYGKTSLNLQVSKFRAEFYSMYNSWKRIEDYNTTGGEDNLSSATVDGMPSWFTLNLKAAYAVTDYLQIQVGCENILDLNYRVFASGISAPGRNIFISLRGRF
ncbi:MAG: TonB-dependent receptor [Bacteroidetes bacterium]|nr:TonB-dependent receptor [Bacteroidota bacterium]MBP7400506.1 TonB-dependent receptor [Chitinophagales bacterium]MBK8487374.1 TonB-dependent receptor [Bacteroidota bacterium]MBP8752918.1 TonB-dependent receptor [Chitinophagales bacterium]MBP9188786.1 TonB-dependent receptor [Chitinophagales bacterium]